MDEIWLEEMSQGRDAVVSLHNAGSVGRDHT